MQSASQKREQTNICIKLYQKIAAFYFQFGYPPSMREMSTMMGLNSTSMIAGYVRVLVDWGWCEIEANKSRTLKLTRSSEIGMPVELGRSTFGSVAKVFDGQTAEFIQTKMQRVAISQSVHQSKEERKAEMRANIRRRNSIRQQVKPFNPDDKS